MDTVSGSAIKGTSLLSLESFCFLFRVEPILEGTRFAVSQSGSHKLSPLLNGRSMNFNQNKPKTDVMLNIPQLIRLLDPDC